MGSEPTDRAEIERLKRRIAELEAGGNGEHAESLSSDVVQGDGDTAGKRAAKVGRSKVRNHNTGKQTNIATDGGAAIRGGVKTRGGHFIGRDFIQFVTEVVHKGDDPDEAQSVIAHYLSALVTDLASLKLGEIDMSATDDRRREPLRLADVYVPLNTQLRIPAKATLVQWLKRDQRAERGDMDADRETRAVTALEALAAHRELTMVGKPGSGKSTFGASVLLTLAQVWQGHRDELAKLGPTWTHGPLLPIRVILRSFAESLPPGEPAHAGDLWDFIAKDLKNAGYGLSTDTIKYVERIARNHGALILLDGLDECGSGAARARVLAAVEELTRTAGNKCRFILTARPYAWPGGPDAPKGVYALADFDDEQVVRFINAWYAALVTRNWRTPGEAERKRKELLQTWRRADLEPLTRNPLLLTLMATLQANRGRLPDDRADLYHESVDLLMLRWNRQIGADRALLDALTESEARRSPQRAGEIGLRGA